MADAIHDQNRVKVKLGVLFSDGTTLVPIAINPTTGGMKANTTDTVSAGILAAVANKTPRDSNFQPAWEGVSSSSSTTTYPIFVDSDGKVLIDN